MKPRPAERQAATKRALKVVQNCITAAAAAGNNGDAAADEQYVWNFGFGANINPRKLQEQRGMRPVEVLLGKVESCRLLFNCRGGFGNLEMTTTTTESAPLALSPKISQPNEVHGVLLKLTHDDFGRLAGMEHGYDVREVTVVTYNTNTNTTANNNEDGNSGSQPSVVKALAFITNYSHKTISRNLLPTSRYINLIKNGAAQMGIDPLYCEWLNQIPSIQSNERGRNYYQTRDRSSGSAATASKATTYTTDTNNSGNTKKHLQITEDRQHISSYQQGGKNGGTKERGVKKDSFLLKSDSMSNNIEDKNKTNNNSSLSNRRAALEQNLSFLLGLDDGGVSDVLDHLLMVENREDLLEYMVQLLGLDDDNKDVIDFIDNIFRYQRDEELIIVKKNDKATMPATEVTKKAPSQTIKSKKMEQKNVTTTNKQKQVAVSSSSKKTPKKIKEIPYGPSSTATTNNTNIKKQQKGKTMVTAEATIIAAKSKNTVAPERGQATIICGCFGIVHKALTNCLYCGRIACVKEGYNFCPFCGYFVDKISVPKNESDKSAWLHKERLLQYDQESAKRTLVFDDQADFFITTTDNWLTNEEKEDAELKQETMRQKASQRSKQQLDIAL